MLETANRDRRTERREATRAEILEAAWGLVRDEGLAGLSLRDLARKVGMQAPSLYSYFESKHAIYDAMFAQGAQEFLDARAGMELSGDTLDDMQSSVRAFVRFCTADPVRYQLLFQRTIPGFEPSPESFAVAVEGLECMRSQLADMGITDPRSLDLLTALGTGITDQQISNDPGGERWERLIDDAMEMYFNHVTRKAATNRRKRT